MSGFRQFLEDQFAPIAGVSIRRMFGGMGVFQDGVMFGLVDDDTLYFRADEDNRDAFEAEGSSAFTYTGKAKPVTMPYWRAPERLYDDPEEFQLWAEAAIAAARRAKAVKPIRSKNRNGSVR